MEKLSLAFYTDTYMPAIDGVVSSIINFRKELESRGHSVYIFTSSKVLSNPPKMKNVFFYPGIGFKPYPQYSVALFPYNSILKLSSLNIDIIHAHTPFFMGLAGMMSSKVGKYPLVGSFHTMVNNKSVIKDYYPKNPQLRKLTTKYLWMYVIFFYKKCNAITTPSNTISQMLIRHGLNNVNTIPNTVDPKLFNRKVSGMKIRHSLGIKDNDKVILYVGRLSKEKKLEVLLKSAKYLKKNKKLKFLIAGSGPAEIYYKGMAKRLQLENVKFLGSIKRENLPEVYASSDVFCIPSTFETQGIVALEAMAMGKPVVCADYLALKELVSDGKNGEKFKPGDYIECSKKIEKALNNTDVYINEAVKTAMDFYPKKVTDKLLDVYYSVLNSR
ncbi:MAG: glycosyltransferase [Candidatus Micrarchaeaceae archaeon]